MSGERAIHEPRMEIAGSRRGLVALWALVGLVCVSLVLFLGYVVLEMNRGAAPAFLEKAGGVERGGRVELGGRRGSGGKLSGHGKYGSSEGLRGSKGARGPGGSGGAHAKGPPPLRLAGSGSNLPLTRRLAEAFMRRPDGCPVVVHRSIGSRGGVQAVRDRRIHLGLVSRGLHPKEKTGALKVYPYAKVSVVVAAHPTVPESGLSREELLSLFAGDKTRWSDGSEVVLLQRGRGDSSHLAVGKVIPKFQETDEQARREGRFRVLFSDRAMGNHLVSTRGAVGLYDLGAVVSGRLPLKVLGVDGVKPSQESLEKDLRSYPFWKTLSFVSRGALKGATLRFVRFVWSPEGRRIVRRNGYLPVPLVPEVAGPEPRGRP